jgi:hypothetical protein
VFGGTSHTDFMVEVPGLLTVIRYNVWKFSFGLCPLSIKVPHPGSPTGTFPALFPLWFYPMAKAEYSFRNFVILLFYNLDDGQIPKEQF